MQVDGVIDVVVWNPWVDKSKRMTDFGDHEYGTGCVHPHHPHSLTPSLHLGTSRWCVWSPARWRPTSDWVPGNPPSLSRPVHPSSDPVRTPLFTIDLTCIVRP